MHEGSCPLRFRVRSRNSRSVNYEALESGWQKTHHLNALDRSNLAMEIKSNLSFSVGHQLCPAIDGRLDDLLWPDHVADAELSDHLREVRSAGGAWLWQSNG